MSKSVIFVCLGNICRSPAGEGLMRKLVEDRGLSARVEVDSAGTIGYHTGNPADPRMRSAAVARGYRLDSRARRFEVGDLDRFDLIIAMDRDNLSEIEAHDARGVHAAKIRLLSDFLPKGAPRDVPDPYYGGEDGFERVLDMIEQACPAILDHLLTD